VGDLEAALRIQNFKYEELKIAFTGQVENTESRDAEIILFREAADANEKRLEK